MYHQKFAEHLRTGSDALKSDALESDAFKSDVSVRPLKMEATVLSDDASELDLANCEIPLIFIQERMQALDDENPHGHLSRKEPSRKEPWWDDAREVDLSLCEFPSLSDPSIELENDLAGLL
jgi:hypothetical protein